MNQIKSQYIKNVFEHKHEKAKRLLACLQVVQYRWCKIDNMVIECRVCFIYLFHFANYSETSTFTWNTNLQTNSRDATTVRTNYCGPLFVVNNLV